MVNHYTAVNPDTRKRKITPELAAYLTSKETLQKWAGMPLKWRVGQLLLEQNLSVSTFALLALYKAHGISYRATGYMHYNGLRITAREKRDYAIKLQAIVNSESPLIYVDESSFNTWKRINKTWAPKYNIIHLPL